MIVRHIKTAFLFFTVCGTKYTMLCEGAIAVCNAVFQFPILCKVLKTFAIKLQNLKVEMYFLALIFFGGTGSLKFENKTLVHMPGCIITW